MSLPVRALIVGDSEDDSLLILQALRKGGFQPVSGRVDTPEAMRSALADGAWDIVLSDYSMSNFSGKAAIQVLKQAGLQVPFVVVSSAIGEEQAVEIMREGAQDCLGRNDLSRLAPAVTRELQAAKQRRERQRSEVLLRESEQRYRSVANASNEAIVSINSAGEITGWDGAAERLFAYTAAEILGQPATRILDPAEHSRLFAELRRIEAGGTLSIAGRLRSLTGQRKDGSLFPVELSAATWQMGGTIYHTATIRDITERKQTEEALRESENKGRALFNNSQVGMFRTRLDGSEMLDLNDKFLAIFGRTRAEMQSLPSAAHWADPKEREEMVRRLKAEGCVMDFGCRMLNKSGEVRTCVTSVRLFPDEGCLEGSILDITERTKTEAALEVQSTALEAAANAIVITDSTGVIQFVNRAFAAMTGFTAEEAIGKNPRELVKSGCHDPEFYRRIWKTILAGNVWRGEIVNRRKNGTTYTEEMTITPVRTKAGEISHFIAIKEDITARKQAEEMMMRAQRLESLGMLASGIAHDLNNMLAPIIFTGPLLRDSLSSPRDLKLLDTLERSAERGAGLVRQILSFAHGTAGELKLIQVKHLARDILGMLEATFPKSIQLDYSIAADAWAVMGDATQLHQVLLNLSLNARDAMPQGGTLHIRLVNRHLTTDQAREIPGGRAGDWLVLDVTDTGTGIAPDVVDHIWEPFFTTKAESKGTGLGLPTVRGIVNRHMGFVELRTKVGHGTTVRVYLPPVRDQSGHSANYMARSLLNGTGELILVVDDDQAIRDTLVSVLGRHGYRVLQASDGVEAIRFFTSHFFEVAAVLIDVGMPVLNGPALARVLLQLSPNLPLISMSGEADGADVSAARELTRAFLAKPFPIDNLLGCLHRVLHSAEGE